MADNQPILTDTHKWQLLALLTIICAALYFLSPILTPFAISALLAYIADPLVDKLEDKGLSRTVGVIIVFAGLSLLLAIALLILIPMLNQQIRAFFEQLPEIAAWFKSTAIPWVESKTRTDMSSVIDPDRIVSIIKSHWAEAGGFAGNVVQSLTKSGMVLLAVFANLLLIPVVTFYLLRDWDRMVHHVGELLPRSVAPTAARLAKEADQTLGAFMRGQLSVMAALASVYAVGFSMVGVNLGVLIGVVAGVLSIVPYLGNLIGLVAAIIAVLVEYGDWMHVLMVLIVFGVGQSLEGMVLTPLLVGDRIGLHPVAVIFAVMAGGQLFGFLGVLVALPVAAVLMVLIRYLHEQWVKSHLYVSAHPDALPSDDTPNVLAEKQDIEQLDDALNEATTVSDSVASQTPAEPPSDPSTA